MSYLWNDVVKFMTMTNNDFEFSSEDLKSWMESFLEHFKSLFSESKIKSSEDLDEYLVNVGESEEEKELIRQHLDEINFYYESLKELQDAKKQDPNLTNEEWLIKIVKDEVNMVNRKLNDKDLSEEEIKNLEKAIQVKLDENIKSEADLLSQEVDVFDKLEKEERQ